MRKLIVAVIIAALGYVAGVAVFAREGKAFVEGQLEKSLKRRVTISGAGISFPFTVVLEDVDVPGLLKIDEVKIYPAVTFLLRGKLAANRVDLTAPYLIYAKDTDVRMPDVSGIPGIVCRKLNIKYGKVDFIDRTIGQRDCKVSVRDIRAELSVPSSGRSSNTLWFNVEGIIPERDYSEPCRVTVDGWINADRRDVRISLNLSGFEGWYVYPYLSGALKLEKANIEKASLNFTGTIFGLRDDLIADCRVELADIVFKSLPAGQPLPREEEMALLVLDVFHSLDQGKVFLDFTVKTRLDKPEIDYSIIRRAFEAKLSSGLKIEKFNAEKIVVLPRKFLKSTFMGAVNISRSVLGGTKQVGMSLKDEVMYTFIAVDGGKGGKQKTKPAGAR
ncbi:MAG: DUF748 domain-containing protein [Candidatus Omnitrophica bacterium]|nr:DUF748 domain-containing protein [Candidatus Omnitrophota bacterium]